MPSSFNGRWPQTAFPAMSMSDTHSKQLGNAHAILKHLSAQDWDAVLGLDFKHELLPASVPSADGKENRGKNEFVGLLRTTFATVFEGFTVILIPSKFKVTTKNLLP